MVFNSSPKDLDSMCDLITDGSHFSPAPRAEGYPIVNAKDIPNGRINLDSCTRISKADWITLKKQNCAPKPGDVLLSKDGTIGRVVHYESDLGVVALSSIAIIRPKCSIDSSFMSYLLLSDAFRSQLRMLESGSALRRIILKDIRNLAFRFPGNKSEQAKIAEVLSTADRAIEQTEGLIAKQQRIKTGLMQDLLSKGVDKNGNLRSEETHEFKDSSLGRIPAEWDVVKVKDIAKIITGNKDTQDRDDSAQYPFFVRSQTIERIHTFSFDGEAVLTAGDGVGTGKVFHYINGKFDFHQRVYCMHSFNSEMNGYFFFQYFRNNFLARVTQFSAKGSVDSVRMTMIADMFIPKPSNDEQKILVDVLKASENAEAEYTKHLSKLRSLKTALMQDLLSGKVRVTPLLDKTEAGA